MMNVVSLASFLFAGTVLAQTPQEAVADSPNIAEVFGELDALSAAIANRLRDLAQRSGLPPAPPPPEPAPRPSVAGPPADSGGVAGSPPPPLPDTGEVSGSEIHEAEPQSCGTREDTDLRIGEVEERYGGFRQAINAANGELPTYREDVRDTEKVCTPQVEGSIASAISRLDRLDIDTASAVAAELLTCVDQRRRTNEKELNQPNITSIRIRLLSDELGRLTRTTRRVHDMGQALMRAANKRRRLVEELTQIRQEISKACSK